MAYPDFEPFELRAGTLDDARQVPLARVLKNRLSDWTWSQVRNLCKSGRVTVDGRVVYDARRQVAPGARVVAASRPVDERHVVLRGDFRIIAEDPDVVVVFKPAGVSMVPHEAGDRLTVRDLVRRAWRSRGLSRTDDNLFVVHRLPPDTSGLLVLARHAAARTFLLAQLRGHVVHPEFIAVVHGRMARDRATYRSRLAPDRGDGKRGSVKPPQTGKEAVTHIQVVARLEGASVVRCTMETNRTHQVRIHLAEAGHPILGETVYLEERDGPAIEVPRLALHASRLAFKHPRTGQIMRYFAPPPADLGQLVSGLGGNPDTLTGWGARPPRRTMANNPRLREWWQTGGDPRATRLSRQAGHPGAVPGARKISPEPAGDATGVARRRPRKRVRPPRKAGVAVEKERARKLERLKEEIDALVSKVPAPPSRRRKGS